MSLNGMNLGLKTTTFGGQVEFYDSQQMRFIRGGATVDQTYVGDGYKVTENNITRKIIPAGTFFGKLASGLFAPVKKTELTVASATGSADITVANAKAFQAGDTILINATAATVLSVDYATNVITCSAAVGVVEAIGAVVKATGTIAALATAEFLGTEAVDVTDGDTATTGIDEGRVINARLPIAATAAVKADLPYISFK